MPAIKIRKQNIDEMLAYVRRVPLEECCGLLAGSDGVISVILPATNAASDPAKNYEIAPKELFRLMREIRAAKLELLGIYHSHPNGKNEPSARDIELAYYPGTPYFILSPLPPSPGDDASRPVRAFSICDGRATELEIQNVKIAREIANERMGRNCAVPIECSPRKAVRGVLPADPAAAVFLGIRTKWFRSELEPSHIVPLGKADQMSVMWCVIVSAFASKCKCRIGSC